MIKVSKIKFFGEDLFLACDGLCEKAWGIENRPRIDFDEYDPDDFAFLADGELGEAPLDPGNSEGGDRKPTDKIHNKWCARQCERSTKCPTFEIPKLKSRSERTYNQPWKHKASVQ